MLYELNDWEDNGYHDSYFYGIFWDSEKEEVVQICTGATAYAAGPSLSRAPLNEDVLEFARRWLVRKLVGYIRGAYTADIEHPKNLAPETRVVLKKDTRKVFKYRGPGETCRKCKGAGAWVNPHNAEDRRSCFGCEGKGYRGKIVVLKVKGKRRMAIIPAGAVGTVVSTSQTPGTTYHDRGYKDRREVLSSLVILDKPIRMDGQIMTEVYLPLMDLRLDREIPSDEKLLREAERLSYGFNFKPMFSDHGGWLTRNRALEFYKAGTTATAVSP